VSQEDPDPTRTAPALYRGSTTPMPYVMAVSTAKPVDEEGRSTRRLFGGLALCEQVLRAVALLAQGRAMDQSKIATLHL
jgi:hypothetical protein